MKNILHSLAFIVLSASFFFTSCASKRKASTKASAKTNTKAEQKSKTSEMKPAIINTEIVKVETHTTTKTKVTKTEATHVSPEHITIATPLPPEKVSDVFKKSYPFASEITWTNTMASSKPDQQTHDYKANFLLKEEKNTVIYAENGDLIESRAQILPDQLPQNVYTAIKNKYADAEIVSATTYKSTKVKGSYTAIVKSQAFATLTEVILTDTGVFVE